MAEYNFWDDRTTECNDDNFCPIINHSCYKNEEECENCPDYLEFCKCVDEREKMEVDDNG